MTIFYKIAKKILPEFSKNFLFDTYKGFKNVIHYGTPDFFGAVEIEINTSCNRKCAYCPNSIYDRGLIKNEKLMEPKLFQKIIDELSRLNYRGFISPHFYGEPLLDKRLPPFMQYTRKKLPLSKIKLFTNGDFLTIEKFHELLNFGVDIFHITQHSKSLSKNLKGLLDYIEGNPHLKDKIYHNKFDSESDMHNRAGIISQSEIEQFKRCGFPSHTVIVDYKGDIVLCCNDYLASHIWGNVKKESLMKIWKKPYYKKTRKNIRKGKFELDLCKKCGVFKFSRELATDS